MNRTVLFLSLMGIVFSAQSMELAKNDSKEEITTLNPAMKEYLATQGILGTDQFYVSPSGNYAVVVKDKSTEPKTFFYATKNMLEPLAVFYGEECIISPNEKYLAIVNYKNQTKATTIYPISNVEKPIHSFEAEMPNDLCRPDDRFSSDTKYFAFNASGQVTILNLKKSTSKIIHHCSNVFFSWDITPTAHSFESFDQLIPDMKKEVLGYVIKGYLENSRTKKEALGLITNLKTVSKDFKEQCDAIFPPMKHKTDNQAIKALRTELAKKQPEELIVAINETNARVINLSTLQTIYTTVMNDNSVEFISPRLAYIKMKSPESDDLQPVIWNIKTNDIEWLINPAQLIHK